MEIPKITIGEELIKSLSFDDTPILKTEFYPEQKLLKLYLKGSIVRDNTDSLFMNRKSTWLGEGVLVFKDWGSLNIRRYISKNEFVLINHSEIEPLEDILKFEESENIVRIGGLGMETAHWEEWIIEGSTYFGEFEEYPATL